MPINETSTLLLYFGSAQIPVLTSDHLDLFILWPDESKNLPLFAEVPERLHPPLTCSLLLFTEVPERFQPPLTCSKHSGEIITLPQICTSQANSVTLLQIMSCMVSTLSKEVNWCFTLSHIRPHLVTIYWRENKKQACILILHAACCLEECLL